MGPRDSVPVSCELTWPQLLRPTYSHPLAHCDPQFQGRAITSTLSTECLPGPTLLPSNRDSLPTQPTSSPLTQLHRICFMMHLLLTRSRASRSSATNSDSPPPPTAASSITSSPSADLIFFLLAHDLYCVWADFAMKSWRTVYLVRALWWGLRAPTIALFGGFSLVVIERGWGKRGPQGRDWELLFAYTACFSSPLFCRRCEVV